VVKNLVVWPIGDLVYFSVFSLFIGAGDAAASPSKNVGAKLIRFGEIWAKLRRGLGKIKAKSKVIRFGQI